jgi:hydroxyacid-oxoacid transhydrogenase
LSEIDGGTVDTERIFTMDTSSIKYGPGATREVGDEAVRLGCRRVLLVTDERLRDGTAVTTAQESLNRLGVDYAVFADVRVEPTDASFRAAIDAATAGGFDGFVAVGGGSVIDTAKAANLYSTYPADLLTYVNPPVGDGRPVPGPLKPLIAVPTTAGTGSETTGVAIFDLPALKAKTGIAHRALRPSVGIVDPENTRTLPPMVAACSGLDVLSHALESYTALSYDQRPAPTEVKLRPAYQGSNPISDIWAGQAIRMCARYLVRAVQDPSDDEARSQMMLAAAFAGIGFGNAGVHLPHGMSYPISGLARGFVPAGYPDDHAIVPHGMSVILTAPAVFRWTARANPERHLEAARLLGADTEGAGPGGAGEILASVLIEVMKQTGMPNGLNAVGITEADLDILVEGTIPQHRVTKLSPRPADPEALRALFTASMSIW